MIPESQTTLPLPLQSQPKVGLSLRVLGSGSSGNCSLVTFGGSAVLIDAGFSFKEIKRRLDSVGFDISRLSAVWITHEHSDHIQSAHTLSRRLQIPIFATEGTYAAAFCEKKLFDWVEVVAGRSVEIGPITIHPISLPHDAADPVGLRIECGGRVLGHMTDFGYVSGLVRESLRGCDAVLLEANHDLEMLRDGPYPWPLKQRIASKLGHLSNEAMLELLPDVVHDGLEHIVFGHLSGTNNHVQLLRVQIKRALERIGLPKQAFSIARQNDVHDEIAL